MQILYGDCLRLFVFILSGGSEETSVLRTFSNTLRTTAFQVILPVVFTAFS
jgi:hypothetical protein